MRSLISTAFVSLLLCSSASAQTTYMFRGYFSIFSKSDACVGSDPVGTYGVIRFGVAADGRLSTLALYQDDVSQAFRLNASFSADYQTVQTMVIRTKFAPSDNPVQIRMTQRPATIRNTSSFVSLSGRINGYNSITDCEVGFRAALVKERD